MTPSALAMAFVTAVNAHDLDRMLDLMAPQHRLIDPAGVEVKGADALRRAWQSFFTLVPDYSLKIDELMAQGDVVLLVGSARGTYAPAGTHASGGVWSTPAVWRAVAAGEQLAEWRIYADLEPLRKIIRPAAG